MVPAAHPTTSFAESTTPATANRESGRRRLPSRSSLAAAPPSLLLPHGSQTRQLARRPRSYLRQPREWDDPHARGTDDLVNNVVTGLGTRALYRAAARPRSTAISDAIGGIATVASVGGKQALKRYIPI
ncbi:uncharacterized protein HKW66_Vig0241340 [Vigna angularis]|uniref:Uncharacterized protein n=1 Tax=Phaseolus angularis TaxID=3914 RepID=A0A8T0JJ98_PHAAN|nr:uncharacterized protein HKW66_Vig0241340 [Vigna angularis]